MDIDLLSYENRVQIVLDWINTIDDADCLLVSTVEDLQDGNIFCKIIDYFLKSINQEEEPLNFFENAEELNINERYNNIINILLNFTEDPETLKRDYNTGFYKVKYILSFVRIIER